MTEKEWIEEHFRGRVGRFLEVGAFDGKTDSITAGLIEAGWEGVMVEPSAQTFVKLMKQHGNNPKITLVHAAVTGDGGMMTFYDNILDGQRSSILKGWGEGSPIGCDIVPYRVPTITMTKLLKHFGGTKGWQFVMIDVEGITADLINQLPLSRMSDTEVLCLEFDRHGDEIRFPRLVAPFYKTAKMIFPNVVSVRQRPGFLRLISSAPPKYLIRLMLWLARYPKLVRLYHVLRGRTN
jgi:FkbM family methyltransferase